MLAPLFAAVTLLASAHAATVPVARTTGNTCAAVDLDLILTSRLLWPFTNNYGKLKSCLCTNTLDQYLQTDVVTRAAVDAVGLASVRSFVATALRFSSFSPGSCYVSQGLTCVPCPLKNDAAVNLNAGLKLGLSTAADLNTKLDLGTSLKTDLDTFLKTGLKTDLKTGLKTDLDTSLKTDLETGLKTDLKTGLRTDLDTSLKTDLKAGLKTDLKTDLDASLKADVDTSLKTDLDVNANLDTKTHVGRSSNIVVGSKADLDLITTAKLGSKVVDVDAFLAAAANAVVRVGSH